MNASLPPPAYPLHRVEEPDLLRLVDKLASEEWTPEEFLLEVQQLEQIDADVGWEVLALLDQYFRRKKITPAQFVAVKKRLEQRHLAGVQGQAADPLPAALSTGPTPAQLLPASAPAAAAAPSPAPTAASASAASSRAPAAAPSPGPIAASANDNTLPAWRAGILLRGRYRVTEVLQRSPSEMLVEAVDEVRAELAGVRQRVAIHVLNTPGEQDLRLLQRLCELQALSHPGIVRFFDVDAEPGALYLTRELLNGRTLQALVEQYGQRLDHSVAQMILGTVASALAHAHSRDVFHGDVSATNVFIADVGEVRLTGFELRPRVPAPSAAADHLAFARLAYELLSGSPAPLADLPGEGTRLRVKAPPGVSKEQWRGLHDTLTGNTRGRSGHVLALFGGSSTATAGNVTLLQTGAPVPPRRRRGWAGWIAAGLVACLLAATAYVFVRYETETVPPASVLPVVPDTPPPEVPAASPPSEESTVTAPAPQLTPAPAAARTPPPAGQRAQLDLPNRVIRVDGNLPVARIWVRRQGSLRGEATFLWWTEIGTAEADIDFREIQPRMAIVASGASGVELLVPIVPNAQRQSPRTFYVKIDSPGTGARLGERTLMQVMIVPPGT